MRIRELFKEEGYDTQRDRDAVSGKPRKSYSKGIGAMKKAGNAKADAEAKDRKEKAEKAAVDNVKKVLNKESYDDGGLGVVEKLLQGITKDFVKGDDKAADEMVAMLKKYNAPMDKVADMLEQKAKELTKKTFSIFDNPLKKTPAGDAADRMTVLADYIRSKANRLESVSEEATAGATSAAAIATVANPVHAKGKIPRDKNGVPKKKSRKNSDGTVVNALDAGDSFFGAKVAKR